MKTRTLNTKFTQYMLLTVLLMAGTAAVLADDAPEPRITTTSQGQGIERGGVGDGVISHDERAPMVLKGDRKYTSRGGQARLDALNSAGGALKNGSSVASTAAATADGDFWFFDADVILYGDLDRDGYWSGIDLAFDADTIYSAADVYAVVYLSYELGPWNEYTSTEDFTIFGASGDDEYVIETDLVSGYFTGEYDLLIELFDAFDGTFLASFGPEDSSELALLPLEDIGRDTPPGTTVVVSQGGGGSLGWFALLALLAMAGFNQRSIRG